MFHDIPAAVEQRMRWLGERDRRDRADGTPHLERLRQIPPETGQFLALLAASAPRGRVVEVGTSAGYSTLWLALACRARGDRVRTFEVLPEKLDLARETFRLAGVDEWVELRGADARAELADLSDIAFCFLDAEKDAYGDLYELAVPRLVPGGLLVADNLLSHAAALAPFRDRALADARVDALVVPLGKGELVCRKCGA